MISLRPISLSDLGFINELSKDYSHHRGEWISPDDSRTFVREASAEIEQQGQGWFIITSGETSIGVLRIVASHVMDDAMEIDFAVAESQRGRGYAPDAVIAAMQMFGKQGRRFVIRVDKENSACVRVAEKCQFTQSAMEEGAIDYGKGPKGTLLVFERVSVWTEAYDPGSRSGF